MKRNKFVLLFSTLFVSFSIVSCNPNQKKSNPVVDLSVSGPDNKFVVNETLYKKDISVYAIYQDNTASKVTDFTCPEFDNASSYTFTTAKTYTFNITYSNVTKPLNITVKSSAKEKDAYTVFLYMCASTLEDEIVEAQEKSGQSSTYGAATADLVEILGTTTATPDNVNIVIETGGTTKWGNYLGDMAPNPNMLQRFHVHDHTLKQDYYENYVSGSTCINMGDASTLSKFLTWGIEKYPAENYALILWDHGSAMQGVCYDSKYAQVEGEDGKMLLNSDVKTALASAKTKAGKKFEWIGYDACLMAIQDVADFNSDYCNYMVASQENEPADGWCYRDWIEYLYSHPSSTYTKTLLEKICDSYVDYYNDWNSYCTEKGHPEYVMDATLSALDLSKASNYKTQWESFASSLGTDLETRIKFNNFVKKFDNSTCLKFGATYDKEYQEYYYPFDVFDVNSFIQHLVGTYSSLTDVSEALESFVIKNEYTSNYSTTYKPCGLSLFCPVSYCTPKKYYNGNETNYPTWLGKLSYGNWYGTPPVR